MTLGNKAHESFSFLLVNMFMSVREFGFVIIFFSLLKIAVYLHQILIELQNKNYSVKASLLLTRLRLP